MTAYRLKDQNQAATTSRRGRLRGGCLRSLLPNRPAWRAPEGPAPATQRHGLSSLASPARPGTCHTAAWTASPGPGPGGTAPSHTHAMPSHPPRCKNTARTILHNPATSRRGPWTVAHPATQPPSPHAGTRRAHSCATPPPPRGVDRRTPRHPPPCRNPACTILHTPAISRRPVERATVVFPSPTKPTIASGVAARV